MTTPRETLHPLNTASETTYQYPHASKVARLALLEKRKFWRPNKYKSAARKGFSFEDELQQRRGPFLELGGPTDEGYFHLDGLQLPKRVLLSNVEMPDFVPQAHRDVVASSTDFVIDGSDIDLPDNSLGMVMASHIPYVSFDKFDDLDEHLDLAKSAPLRALKQGAMTPDLLEASLRLKMAGEVYRTLEPGGLFLTDGHFEDIAACELFGFQVMTSVVDARDCYRQDDNRYYRVVLQKPKAPTLLDA